ncbi:hypothetical protein SERLA73DRAFT_74559 [Serpula lacrymans var. lacrymans S7.3]|uniref:Dipeptidyl-peptidase V n=2 Tax=Serpula lacrymans var. lacrymans TaxID=341189 RepID=F8PZL0_SERL3|nr:uncharacterized protein SERLADRAFT_439209 [Serpula lacrymans var. lacrymans S7.9]EGN98332.1 hypothetical protein SERLA73DRAFT_74559 [Serpula lacrymans var. lacrymans S7.3]EGO23898.1 hypothetical protein SERLADRAFT_439209 [Serpula lacrymans var. lacrymans S7.9]
MPLTSHHVGGTSHVGRNVDTGLVNDTQSTTPSAIADGATQFTAEFLTQLPRPGAGIANPAGDLVFVPVSQYSHADKKTYKCVYIVSLVARVPPLKVPVEEPGDAFWLDSRTLAHISETGEEKKKTKELYALSLAFDAGVDGDALKASEPSVLVGSFPTTTVANFRYSRAAERLVLSAYVYPDGDISAVKAKDDAWENRGTTALVYDNTYERHWDKYVGPKESSLFTVSLHKDSQRKWVLGDDYVNALQGTKNHCPVEPFGGTDDFDVSDSRIVYTTKDASLPMAIHTKQDIFLVDFTGENLKELTSGNQGATHNPVFNKQADKVAWLELDEDGHEADRSKIVLYDLQKDIRFTLTPDWDRSPSTLSFSTSGDHLYLIAGEYARDKIFVLPVPPTPEQSSTKPELESRFTTPIALTDHHSALDIQVLSNNRLLFTMNSFTAPNDVYVLNGLDRIESDIQSQVSSIYRGELDRCTQLTTDNMKGLNLPDGEEFWFKGANNKDVQGWLFKPRGWKESDKKKWPILMMIHGGPQWAWKDNWSAPNWNHILFAEHGYFTIAMNPTGSTTFGQEFTDSITGDWGGKPFVDMQNGFKYILDNYPQIDPERAVAAGASWGGYAINWIQGHPELGFNFKAMVNHDGIFDFEYDQYSTDELFFFNHEAGGLPWDSKGKEFLKKYEACPLFEWDTFFTKSIRFNPTNFVHKWATPTLFFHGSKDYRLPETESIGAWHALRQLGVPSRLVIFPDEIHGTLNGGNVIKWHEETFKWLDQYVGLNT